MLVADGTPMSIDSDSIIKPNKDGLQSLQVSLFELGKSPMDVISEEGDFLESVKSAVETKNIDIVVVVQQVIQVTEVFWVVTH